MTDARAAEWSERAAVRGALPTGWHVLCMNVATEDQRWQSSSYTAVIDVLGIPIGGEGNGFFWADELVVSSADSVSIRFGSS